MRKNFLPSNIILLIVGPLFVLVVPLEIYTLFHYHRWRKKSLRSVAEGGPCAPINTKAYQLLDRAGRVVVGIVVLAYLLMEFFSGNRRMILFYIVYTALFVLLVFLLRKTTALLRKLKVSKGLNILGTLLADVVLAALLIGGLTFGAIRFGWFFGGQGETYMYQNQE